MAQRFALGFTQELAQGCPGRLTHGVDLGVNLGGVGPGVGPGVCQGVGLIVNLGGLLRLAWGLAQVFTRGLVQKLAWGFGRGLALVLA